MEYTSLIASTAFDGIKADVLTATGGILSIMIIIIGVGMIIRVLSR